MVAGSAEKKVGGGYSQEDLSIFYYCEKDYGARGVLSTLRSVLTSTEQQTAQ